MGISAYSTTPGSNTAISGINLAEGCNASGINDALRQLMADIASVATGAAPLGALAVTGNTTFNGGRGQTKFASALNLANGGTLDLNVNAGSGGWPGILIVAQGTHGNFSVWTGTTFAIAGRIAQFAQATLSTVNGVSGGSSFTLSCPSDGTVRLTNTSGATVDVDMFFIGATLT